MIKKVEINKVLKIVPGGKSGQESIYNGLCAAEDFTKSKCDDASIVLIHDGVRPLITENTITNCCDTVWYGYTCKTFTMAENPITNCCDTIWYIYACKTSTIIECIITNCLYCIW